MSITVVKKPTPGEYIGRGSPLGNPFVIGKDGDRDAVCEKYHDWFHEHLHTQPDDSAFIREIRRLYVMARDTGELRLQCFCAPQRCHGDTIKNLFDSHLEY